MLKDSAAHCQDKKVSTIFLIAIVIVFTAAIPLWGDDLDLEDDAFRNHIQEREAPAGTLYEHTHDDRPSVNALRVISGEIEVDGNLDESFWQTASPATGFIQFEPLSGEKATERTEVRVLFDEYNLYIGAYLYDSDPNGIIADEMRRDSDIERNDTFMIIIDTYHDRRNGFYFETNPLGAKVDALVFDEGEYLDYNWNGLWWSESKKTSDGWQVEIRIPFSTLRFNELTSDIWGVQFGRLIRRKNETVYWTHIPYDATKWRLSLAGNLTGLQDIYQRIKFSVKPYALAQQKRETRSDGEKNTSISLDAGLDIKYFIFPNLIADLTVNPDFAQVEADEQKINVTRFPLFYPEKREFFLEGSGYFDFGLDAKIQPYYSRRIGLASSGEEIPIIAGGKLSGKAGKYGIGLLNVETKDEDEEPQTNYAVVRLKRDIQDRGSAGFIAINKEPKHGNHNRAFGADLYLPLFDYLYVDSFVLTTDTEGVSGDENAGYISVAWQDPAKYLNLSYLDVDDLFNPEVGFVKRTGIKESVAYSEVYIRPSESSVRKYSFFYSFLYLTDQENMMIGRDNSLGFTTTFHSGDYWELSYLNHFDLLEDDFEIRPGIIVPPGGYNNDVLSLSLSTDESRKLSGYFFASYGGYFDGDRTTYSASLKLKPSKHFKILPGFTREEVDLSEGSFDANIVTSTIEYTLSTRAFMNALLQWNEESEELSTNLRFNYEYSSGSNIYLVYNETRSTGGEGLIEQAVIFKITKLWSL